MIVIYHSNQGASPLHISEGFLPWQHAAFWTAASLPFAWDSMRTMSRRMAEGPETRLHLAAATGFLFVLTALKLPSFGGTCSHAVGVAFGAILLGPRIMTALGVLVLLFQALLLAHGGITSLGANVFALGVVGPWVAWAIARGTNPPNWRVFLAGLASSLATYAVTSLELAAAFPDTTSGILGSFSRFAGLFALTQVPIGVVEGSVTFSMLGVVKGYLNGTDRPVQVVS
jgi:cobalt/nickel transport system permease protein